MTTEAAGASPATGTVVIPAYNEAGIIADTLHRIAEVLRRTLPARAWEIVVVDDGSADDTAHNATTAATAVTSTGVQVRVLRHAWNRGLGAALQTGLGSSTGDVVVVVDCDLSYHPDHIPELVRAFERHSAQVVVASPYMPGGQTLGVPPGIERRSRAANRFLARVSGIQVHTLTGMVRAYDGPFVRELALKSTGDVINVEALYKALVLRGRVVEIPATLDWSGMETRAGRSRARTRRVRTKTYQMVASGLLFRPYLAFLAAGTALIGLGGLLGLWSMLWKGSPIGLTVLGVSLLGTGLLVNSASLLSLQVKRCFEELYFMHSRARGFLGGPITVSAAAVRAPAAPPAGADGELPRAGRPEAPLVPDARPNVRVATGTSRSGDPLAGSSR